jgi:site-specific recombinase XerD
MVSPKSNRIRYVPLAPEVQHALEEFHRPSGLVFSAHPTIPVNEKVPRRAIIRICKESGIRRIGWHVLRHTFASQLVMAGVNMKTVQELLGHSDIRMTMRYAHLAPSALHEAVRLLEQRVVVGDILGQPVGNGLTAVAAEPAKLPQFLGRV